MSRNPWDPDHILIENGALHGILDWGDAGWGDPASDFAIAAFWGVLPEALAHYGGPMDAGFAERARHAAACMIAGQIAFAAVSGKEEFTRDGLAALNRFRAGGDPSRR